MDANLQKILDYHLEDIKKGKTNKALDQAQDYLGQILDKQKNSIALEFINFTNRIMEIKEEQNSSSN